MFSPKSYFIFICSVVLMLSGCASKHEKKLEKEIATTPAVSSSSEVDANVKTIIENSTHLTPDQKVKLLALREEVKTEIALINQEWLKLHQVLVSEFVKEDSSKKQIRMIKRRMSKNSKKRLETIFRGMDEAERILGHNTVVQNADLMNSFYQEQIDRKN